MMPACGLRQALQKSCPSLARGATLSNHDHDPRDHVTEILKPTLAVSIPLLSQHKKMNRVVFVAALLGLLVAVMAQGPVVLTAGKDRSRRFPFGPEIPSIFATFRHGFRA